MLHLVTGGAGFIGSHLVNRLLAVNGDTVRAFDNESRGKFPSAVGHGSNVFTVTYAKPLTCGEQCRTAIAFSISPRTQRLWVVSTGPSTLMK